VSYLTLWQALDIIQGREPAGFDNLIISDFDREMNDADRAAALKLHAACASDAVTAVGITGDEAAPIPALKWLTLTIMSPEYAGDPMGHMMCPGPAVYGGLDDQGNHVCAYDRVLIDSNSLTQAFSAHKAGESDVAPDRTGAPGRPSSMHLVELEAARRRSAGETKQSVKDEAKFLEQWLKDNHPGAPPTTAKTIENRIRDKHPRK
jgi:hypothetical protein